MNLLILLFLLATYLNNFVRAALKNSNIDTELRKIDDALLCATKSLKSGIKRSAESYELCESSVLSDLGSYTLESFDDWSGINERYVIGLVKDHEVDWENI